MISVLFIVFGISATVTCQLNEKLPTSLDRDESKELTVNISDEHQRLLIQNSLLYCPGTHMCIPQFSRNVSFQNVMLKCCGGCECNGDCYKKGTCCPTLYLERNETFLSPNSFLIKRRPEKISDVFNCLYPEVLPHHTSSDVPNAFTSYLMIWKCPDEYKDASVSVMCKVAGKSLNPDMDISLVIPVTSLRTNLTYRNKYCGQCHDENETDLIMWEGKIFCPLLYKFAAQSFQEMLRQIIVEEKCNLMFDPNSLVKDIPKSCEWGTFTECNVTGRWDVYDPLIEAGCHGFTMTYLHHYRNVFCFMCNEKEEPMMKCTFGDFKMTSFAARPDAFSGIINFNNAQSFFFADALHDLPNSENCLPGTKYDYFKEKCRNLTCSANLAFNGSYCSSIFDRVNPQMYELNIQFTPEHPNIFTDCETCVLSAINSMVNHVSQFLLEIGNSKNDLCDHRIMYKPANGLPLPPDKLVNISQIVIHCVLYVKSNHDYNKILSDLLKIESEMVILNVSNSHMDIPTGFDVRLIFGDSGYIDEDFSLLQDTEKEIKIKTFYDHPKLSEFTMRRCFMYLRITKITIFKTCPRITISSNEFTIEETDGTCIPEINLCLKLEQHSPLTNGSMMMCSELYFKSIAKIGVYKKNNSDNVSHITEKGAPLSDVLPYILTTAQHLSLYCTTLSIVILIMTIFGFIRTKKYRTLTGKINTIILIMLGLAQVFQELSSLTNRVAIMCEIAGVLTHFTRIATALWINVACFNISKIFLLRPELFQGISEIKHLSMFLAYTGVLSSFFVVTCILVNFFLSNDSHIGYGGLWCFIISNYMFLFTYSLPILITTLVNIIFLISVVVKYGIYVDSKLKLAFHYRLLKRYILLSLIFVLTTSLQTMYKWKSFMAILYTTIALNTAQGILCCILLFRIETNYKGASSAKFQDGPHDTTAESQGANTLQSFHQHKKENQFIPISETQKPTKILQSNVRASRHSSNCSLPSSFSNNSGHSSNGSTPQNDEREWKSQSSEANEVYDFKQIEESKTRDYAYKRIEAMTDIQNISTVLDHSDVILSDGYFSTHM